MTDFRKRSLELFELFAKFECALKAFGFHCGNGDAKANWDKFAAQSEIEKLLVEPASNELSGATQYLLDNSPMKQVVEKGALSWKECEETGNNARKLLLYVRRIRNNLFHGGKMATPWPRDRDTVLLEHSITILRECLNACPTVKEKFDEISY